MIVNVGYNQGNSHYPHWIRAAEIVPIHKGTAETAKTYNGYRKTSILALVKQTENKCIKYKDMADKVEITLLQAVYARLNGG